MHSCHPGHSGLKKRVEKAIRMTDWPRSYKQLVMGDGGRTMASQLVKSNPFPRANCGRIRCGMCAAGGRNGKCWKSNIVYKIQCNRLPCVGGHNEEPVPTYIGESSRTTYTRGLEHQDAYLKKKETSFMWRHCLEKHGGVMGSPQTDYTYGVIESYRHSLDRGAG